MSLIIDIHALQTLPPSLINRDDTGAPKSAVFGGVPRQRVSSQSWKRAIRKHFEENFDSSMIGIRTRRVGKVISNRVLELAESTGATDWDESKASAGVEKLFSPLKIKLSEPKGIEIDDEENLSPETRAKLWESSYLLFLSTDQIEKAAQAILEKDGEKFSKKESESILNTRHSADIAMFGRMVADDPSFNVDAAVQVAHAIGIHESEPEFDYFTAVDDFVEDENETGAGMLGYVQMMSSTLYRFATVDLESLVENLGDRKAAEKSALAFIDGFIKSMPTGKVNTFANNTLPELVYIAVRDSRSISLVNAFEEPVVSDSSIGRRAVGAQRLAREAKDIQEQYGFVPSAAFVLGLGNLQEAFDGLAQQVTLSELPDQLRAAIEG